MTTLRLMATRHSVFYTPLLATFAGGFLQEEGFDARYDVVPPGRNVYEFLARGEIEVGQSAVSYSWTTLDKGATLPAVNFAHINVRDGFFIAARTPHPDFSFARLLDGTLMYVHGGQPEAMLRYALYRRGIALDDIRGIDGNGTKPAMQAFRDGAGEFFHEQGPYPHQLAHEGIAQVVASVGEAIGPVSFSTLAATPAWLKQPAAVKFMRAYRKARAWAHTASPAAIAARVANLFPDIAQPALVQAIAAYQTLGCWEGAPEIQPAHYETALDVFEHSRAIAKRYPSNGIVVSPPDA